MVKKKLDRAAKAQLKLEEKARAMTWLECSVECARDLDTRCRERNEAIRDDIAIATLAHDLWSSPKPKKTSAAFAPLAARFIELGRDHARATAALRDELQTFIATFDDDDHDHMKDGSAFERTKVVLEAMRDAARD